MQGQVTSTSPPCAFAEIGRKGGTRNRHVYESNGKEVAPPQNADVKAILADARAEIRAGKDGPETRHDSRLFGNFRAEGH
jgi:hypothetical protein